MLGNEQLRNAYFSIFALLAAIGLVTLIFVSLIILQVTKPVAIIQNNILSSFSILKEARKIIPFSDKEISMISQEELLEEYSSLAKKFIFLKNKNNENLKAFDETNRQLELKKKIIEAQKREISSLNSSIIRRDSELNENHSINTVLLQLNEQLLNDFEEVTIYLSKLKELKKKSDFELNKYESISNLQVNKIKYLISRLEKQVSNNYKLIDSINKKLGFRLDGSLFQIYKEEKSQFENQIKNRSISDLQKKQILLAFQIKNFKNINKKLKKLKALPLGWPVLTKTRITSSYGFRKDPINKKRKFHYGIDIAGNITEKIVSTGDGSVIFAGPKGGYGLTIIIVHSDNYKSGYSHLNEIFVKTGDKLEKGDIIGLMGSTGRSTGVHLHYEIMKRDEKINPRKFLEAI